MGILDLFSKRQKRARGDVPDIFEYKDIPNQLRVQIVHIIRDAIGVDHYNCNSAMNAYEFINDALCREYGLFELAPHSNSKENAIINFFLTRDDHEQAIDVIELSFNVINTYVRNYEYTSSTDRKIDPDDAIKELNQRFKEHGIGYQFESSKIIRVDSQYVHQEVVKPALLLLSAKIYKGANEEFLGAHTHYLHKRYKECLVDTLKSFESVMKAICDKRGWPYKSGDTAKSLLSICMKNNLIPSYLQSQFTSLRSVLESGVPTVRNKLGGHGQGSTTVAVTEEMARYSLNLTAANILFLVEHEKLL